MGRGAGAAEEFITVGEAASKAIVNSGKKRQLGCRTPYRKLSEDVGAEEVACGFAATDQAGAFPFDQNFGGTAAGIVVRS